MTGSHQPWVRAGEFAGVVRDGVPSPTIFEEMTGLAMTHQAVNLGQGFPDSDGPDWVRQVAADAIMSGSIGAGMANQYAPGTGLLELREALSSHYLRYYNLAWNPASEILVTTGATEAIAASILALVEPGDEVITFEPFYDSYAAMIGLAGAEQVVVELNAPTFVPDPQRLKAAITSRTKMVILNSPHNPTGTVIPASVMQELVQVCADRGIWVLSDEVYEHLVFDRDHVPAASVGQGYDRLVTISSAGKALSLTGWKIGWVLADAQAITAIRTVKQFLTYSSGPVFQYAVAHALNSADRLDEFLVTQKEHLKTQRDGLIAVLRDLGLAPLVPDAGYFVVTDVSPWGVKNATDLARTLAIDYGVVGIPVSALCRSEDQRLASWMRFAFCKSEDVMQEAFKRLNQFKAAVN